MTVKLLPHLSPPANDDLPQKALAKWQAAPSLQRGEHWRWTDFSALFEPARPIELADYQYDLPEEISDDFAPLPARDEQLLTIPTGIFAALNIAYLRETFSLTVPAGAHLDDIASLKIDMQARKMQFSRVHITAEKDSKSALWLEYNVAAGGAQIPVLSIDAAEGAEIDLVLWFTGGAGSAQVMQIQIEAAANAIVRVNALQSRGAIQRVDIESNLRGENAHFSFGGVQCLYGHDVGDFHITVNHSTINSTSNQVLRGALSDHAHGLFYGMINVGKGAFDTNAEQDGRYLLLSPHAKSSSMPCLLINTAEVKCAHGATAGELHEEALFYLRSRGIPIEQAQKMLILSFLLEAVIVKNSALRAAMEEAIGALWYAEAGDE